MNNMKNFIPENIVNNIVDYVVCDCGWSKNHDETHENFSDKECDKIDWDEVVCYECEQPINKDETYIDIKSRCAECHLNNITEYVYGSREMCFTDFEMAGGSANWWNYRVYFDEDGDQYKVCKVSAHGEENLNDALYCYIEDPDRVLLMSEIPEELESNFYEISKNGEH